eukprot:112320-Amorphochlora_amoeboformis.AAC.1
MRNLNGKKQASHIADTSKKSSSTSTDDLGRGEGLCRLGRIESEEMKLFRKQGWVDMLDFEGFRSNFMWREGFKGRRGGAFPLPFFFWDFN